MRNSLFATALKLETVPAIELWHSPFERGPIIAEAVTIQPGKPQPVVSIFVDSPIRLCSYYERLHSDRAH